MKIDTTTKWLIGAFIVAVILAYGCYAKRPLTEQIGDPDGYIAPSGSPTTTAPTTTPPAF